MLGTTAAPVNPDARPAATNKHIPLSSRLSGVLPRLSLDSLVIHCCDHERKAIEQWLGGCPSPLSLRLSPQGTHPFLLTSAHDADFEARKAALKARLLALAAKSGGAE